GSAAVVAGSIWWLGRTRNVEGVWGLCWLRCGAAHGSSEAYFYNQRVWRVYRSWLSHGNSCAGFETHWPSSEPDTPSRSVGPWTRGAGYSRGSKTGHQGGSRREHHDRFARDRNGGAHRSSGACVPRDECAVSNCDSGRKVYRLVFEVGGRRRAEVHGGRFEDHFVAARLRWHQCLHL